MQTVLNTLIHKGQSGFMKGIYVGESLLELPAIIEYCDKYNIEAIIVSFDFEKAFDKVEWNILNAVLKFFNFGENFRSWIEPLRGSL